MQTNRKIRHPSRDFTVPIVVAKIPIVVAIPGSDGGDCFHGSKKHSSLPPAAARLLKGCPSSLYHCFFLPYDSNGVGSLEREVGEGAWGEVVSDQYHTRHTTHPDSANLWASTAAVHWVILRTQNHLAADYGWKG